MTTNLTPKGKKIRSYFFNSSFFGGLDDSTVDRLIEESYSHLYSKALNKANIQSSDCIRDSVLITGPRFQSVGGAEIGIKKGKDGIIRFIPIGVTIINFLPHQLVAYQCAYDPTTENALNESTLEYFYKDIVSLETKTISKTEKKYTFSEKVLLKIPVLKKIIETGSIEQYNEAEVFVLTTSGSTKLEVTLSEKILIEAVGGGEIPKSLSERSILAVRRMIREKKMNY